MDLQNWEKIKMLNEYDRNTRFDKIWLGSMIIACFAFLCVVGLTSCGFDNQEHGHEIIIEGSDYEKKEKEEKKEISFSKDEMEKSCFSAGCHNKAAPFIPLIGKGFKTSAKVRARIKNGSMPPKGWDNAKISAALNYLDSK